MSWLNLKRLLPPRKLWKLFSKKLQFKLHKLNRCKAIKKQPTIQSHKATKKIGFPSLSIQPKQFKLKKINNPHTWTHQQKRRHYNYLQKGAAPPVYVDQLFVKPVSLIKESSKEESCSSSSNLKEDEIFNHRKTFHSESCNASVICSTADDDEDKNTNVINSADDLWESLLLASPQMRGIDERAEEFIARFRAEMQNQETLEFNNMNTSP